MTIAATAPRPIDLRAIANAFGPAPTRFDPFGLVSGYRAYTIYTALAAKSDTELAALGLTRSELPQVAMTAVNDAKAA